MACASPAFAQSAPPENARMEYAQVLRAEPVYQTLRATSMVERCEALEAFRNAAPEKQPDVQ